MPTNPFLTQDQQIIGDTYTSTETLDNLTILCDDFGARFGGSDEEHQAAEFMAAKFKEYGLHNVHLEPVEFTGWTRGQARLEIIEPIQKTLPCITLPHSPPCQDLVLTLIDLDDGHPDDFEAQADDIKGKIVLTTSVSNPKDSERWIHRSEKYHRSMLAGAGAFIFVNHYPGYGPATGSIGWGRKGAMPAISIRHEDGEFIRRVAKRKGEVKLGLTTTDAFSPMTSYNVIADLPAQVEPAQIVMLGSHYDGHDISQGAGDPASGAVSVMEAARVLAKYAPELPYTMRFALWGIEEIGLLGSYAYVDAHADILDQVRFYFNMDAAGVLASKDVRLNEWPELQATFAHWSQEMTTDFAVGQSVMAFSDHYPFFLAGVPTGGMESIKVKRAGRGYGHTAHDTLDKIDLNSLREAATLAARLILRIASDRTWPVSRRSKEAVTNILNSSPNYQIEQALEAQVEAFYEK